MEQEPQQVSQDPGAAPWTMAFTDGTPGAITFFPFDCAISWDFLLERGYGFDLLNHGTSLHDYRNRIRQRLSATWYAVRVRDRKDYWYRWDFRSALTQAWVRTQDSEQLFRELAQLMNHGFPPDDIWVTGPIRPQWECPWMEGQGGAEAEPYRYGLRGGNYGMPLGTGLEPWSHVRDLPNRTHVPMPDRHKNDPRVLRWAAEAARKET